MTGMTSSLPRKIRRFGRDRRGVSAVEFAFIAPVMIGLYLGCAEISDGVAADRKVSLIAGALANLTASCSSSNANAGSCANNIISTTEMGNIFDASSAIIAPYSAANLSMTVSCLSVDANKIATVKWSVDEKRCSADRDGDNSICAGADAQPADLRDRLRISTRRSSATPSAARSRCPTICI